MAERKKALRAKMAGAIEFPEDTFGGISHLSMYGNTSLAIDDCVGVLSYTDTEAKLRLRGLILVIRGRNLALHTFFDRRIKISGTIYNIEFEE